MVVLLIRVKKPLIIVAECWITLLNAVRAVLVLDIANCVCCAVLLCKFHKLGIMPSFETLSRGGLKFVDDFRKGYKTAHDDY